MLRKWNDATFTLKHNALEFGYSLDNFIVPRSQQFRDLGIIFDSKLSFTAHIFNISLRN